MEKLRAISITFSLNPCLLDEIDSKRGDVSRSVFIRDAIQLKLGGGLNG